MDEMTKRLSEVELYVEKRTSGALSLSLISPHGVLMRVFGRVSWEGHESDPKFPSF